MQNIDYGKRLFGIWDYPLQIKKSSPKDVLFAWGDVVRMNDASTYRNNEQDDDSSIPYYVWSPLRKSYEEIQNKICQLSTVGKIADFAIEMTDNLRLFSNFKKANRRWNNIQNSMNKSMKKYLGLISAYEESISQGDPVKNSFISSSKLILQNLLKDSEINPKDIAKSLKTINKSINDNSKNHNGNIYRLITGIDFNNSSSNIICESVYDILLASAFLSSSKNSNPYSLLLDELEEYEEARINLSEKINAIQSFNDTLEKNDNSNREKDRLHIPSLKKFEDYSSNLTNFLGHFQLREPTYCLFNENNDFANLLTFFAERFSQINFINVLEPFVYEFQNYENKNDRVAHDWSKILFFLNSLASCPLIEFRINFIQEICQEVHRMITEKEPITNYRENVYLKTLIINYYTYVYLPILQMIFKVLLSIYYHSNSYRFPSNDLITKERFSLFSVTKSNAFLEKIKPKYPRNRIKNNSYKKTVYTSYHYLYESLTLDNSCSFPDLFCQHRYVSIFFFVTSFLKKSYYVNSYARGVSDLDFIP